MSYGKKFDLLDFCDIYGTNFVPVGKLARHS